MSFTKRPLATRAGTRWQRAAHGKNAVRIRTRIFAVSAHAGDAAPEPLLSFAAAQERAEPELAARLGPVAALQRALGARFEDSPSYLLLKLRAGMCVGLCGVVIPVPGAGSLPMEPKLPSEVL